MMKRFLGFLNDKSGVAFIEFALAFPILLLLFAGGVELTRYVQANQKVDTAAVQLANYISQQKTPNTNVNFSDLQSNVFNDLMAPFGSADSGFIASGIYPDSKGTGLEVRWQKSAGTVGSSKIGVQGGIAGGPATGLQLRSTEYLVAVEVFHQYENLVPNIAALAGGGALDFSGEKPLYKSSIMRYRLGAVQPRNGDAVIADEPVCCGKLCTQGDPTDIPDCACYGGDTCSASTAALYPSCKLISCGGGGGSSSSCSPAGSCACGNTSACSGN